MQITKSRHLSLDEQIYEKYNYYITNCVMYT